MKKEKGGEINKMKMKIGIVLVALVLSMVFATVAAASVSYDLSVSQGSFYIKETYDTASTGLEYDAAKYDLFVCAHKCGNTNISHFTDFDHTTTEGYTTLEYMPDAQQAIRGILFEESVGVDKIAQAGDSQNDSATCFTADAEFRANADVLNLETQVYIDKKRIAYEATTSGLGGFELQTQAYIQEGVVNGTHTMQHYKTTVGARGAYFEFGGAFEENIPLLPASASASSRICPFMTNP